MTILERPEGIWGAILLPVKDDKIDWVAFEDQVNILCDSSVHGVYTNGTAAECHNQTEEEFDKLSNICLLYTSPSPRDLSTSRMPSSA